MSDEIALQMTVGISAGPRDSKYIRQRPSEHAATDGEITRSDMCGIFGWGVSRTPGSFSKVSPSLEAALRIYPWQSGYGFAGPIAV